MKKILVAEDDRFIANAYRVKLEKAGYELKLVSDGEAVFEALEAYNPDLIILDLVMPKKDGFTVLEEIKKDDQWKGIPVLITSNLSQKEDVDRIMALGAEEYIVKSQVSIENLVQKIAKYVD